MELTDEGFCKAETLVGNMNECSLCDGQCEQCEPLVTEAIQQDLVRVDDVIFD